MNQRQRVPSPINPPIGISYQSKPRGRPLKTQLTNPSRPRYGHLTRLPLQKHFSPHSLPTGSNGGLPVLLRLPNARLKIIALNVMLELLERKMMREMPFVRQIL